MSARLEVAWTRQNFDWRARCGTTRRLARMRTARGTGVSKTRMDAVMARRASRSNGDQDVVPQDGHLEGRDREVRVARANPGSDVESPAVPWAGDNGAFEVALAERPAAMAARVVDRIQL